MTRLIIDYHCVDKYFVQITQSTADEHFFNLYIEATIPFTYLLLYKTSEKKSKALDKKTLELKLRVAYINEP